MLLDCIQHAKIICDAAVVKQTFCACCWTLVALLVAGFTSPGLWNNKCYILGYAEHTFQSFSNPNASCPALKQTPAVTVSLNGETQVLCLIGSAVSAVGIVNTVKYVMVAKRAKACLCMCVAKQLWQRNKGQWPSRLLLPLSASTCCSSSFL